MANSHNPFTQARAAAVELLLRQPRPVLPVDVARLQYGRRILFDSVEHFCSVTRCTVEGLTRGTDCLRDGCTILCRHKGETICVVLYNEKAGGLSRRRFTLAHEVGHICLGHLNDGYEQEALANHFASELLMPRVLVAELARRSGRPPAPAEISAVFGVSLTAARLRIQSLQGGCNRKESLLLERYGRRLPEREGPVVEV